MSSNFNINPPASPATSIITNRSVSPVDSEATLIDPPPPSPTPSAVYSRFPSEVTRDTASYRPSSSPSPFPSPCPDPRASWVSSGRFASSSMITPPSQVAGPSRSTRIAPPIPRRNRVNNRVEVMVPQLRYQPYTRPARLDRRFLPPAEPEVIDLTKDDDELPQVVSYQNSSKSKASTNKRQNRQGKKKKRRSRRCKSCQPESRPLHQ